MAAHRRSHCGRSPPQASVTAVGSPAATSCAKSGRTAPRSRCRGATPRATSLISRPVPASMPLAHSTRSRGARAARPGPRARCCAGVTSRRTSHSRQPRRDRRSRGSVGRGARKAGTASWCGGVDLVDQLGLARPQQHFAPVARERPGPAPCPRRRRRSRRSARHALYPAPRTGSAAGSSGQRGRAAMSSGSEAPGRKRSIPAQAIIAALSVHSRAAGRRSEGRGLPPALRARARTAVGRHPAGDDQRGDFSIFSSAPAEAVDRCNRSPPAGSSRRYRPGDSAPLSRARSTALLSPANEKCGSVAAEQRAGQRHRARVALARQPLDRRPAGKAEAEDLGGLVERFAERVVDRRREPAIAPDALDPQHLAMPAGDQQQRIGKIERRHRPAAGLSAWPSRWLIAISGLSLAIASALAVTSPTITPPIRPGPGGGGDGVDIGQRQTRVAQHGLDQRRQRSAWARAAISGTTPP